MDSTLLTSSDVQTNLKTDISEYVNTYGNMSIPEMLLIDSQIVEETNNESSLSAVLTRLIDNTSDEVNKKLLTKIRNNFDLMKAIYVA